MKNNYIRMFAIFASILMVSIVAVPMVAAEDDYESCLDATEICDETHVEIKELFTELDIAIANYNQASKNGLPTYEYAEEINAITKELAELGAKIEVKELLLLDIAILYENEDLCEKINELIYELKELVTAYNEVVKQGDSEAQVEYFKEIEKLVSELQTLGIDIEIIGNLVITKTIIIAGYTIKLTLSSKKVVAGLEFIARLTAAYFNPFTLLSIFEKAGYVCIHCERRIKAGGFATNELFWSRMGRLGKAGKAASWIGNPFMFASDAITIMGNILVCTNPRCIFNHR